MADQRLILSFFESEAAADSAVESLKQWDKISEEIKFGAIGVLVKDEKGEIKTHKVGRRAGGKGAKTFAVLGAIAGVLSGGITVIGGVVYGAILGGILGSFFHRGLGLSKEELARIEQQLNDGKAAVGLVVDAGEVNMVSGALVDLGGKSESYAVTDEAVEQAVEIAEGVPEEDH